MAIAIENFNIDNVIFEEVKKVTKGDIKYIRLVIKYQTAEGKCDLCIATPELMSWGIQENRQKQNGDSTAEQPADSYSLPLVMSDQATIDVFELDDLYSLDVNNI